jgi:hypothetical protein
MTWLRENPRINRRKNFVVARPLTPARADHGEIALLIQRQNLRAPKADGASRSFRTMLSLGRGGKGKERYSLKYSPESLAR